MATIPDWDETYSNLQILLDFLSWLSLSPPYGTTRCFLYDPTQGPLFQEVSNVQQEGPTSPGPLRISPVTDGRFPCAHLSLAFRWRFMVLMNEGLVSNLPDLSKDIFREDLGPQTLDL